MRTNDAISPAATDAVSPQAFVDAAYAALDQAGIPAEIIVSLDPDDVSGFYSEHPMVKLDYIEVPVDMRGNRWGSKAIAILTSEADRLGVALVLSVASGYDPEEDEANGQDALSGDELGDWYARHGFDGDHLMIRNPRAPQPVFSCL